MKLCEHCLDYLETCEGQIPLKLHVDIDIDEDTPESEHTCDWCEESGFDELWLTGEDALKEMERNPDRY